MFPLRFSTPRGALQFVAIAAGLLGAACARPNTADGTDASAASAVAGRDTAVGAVAAAPLAADTSMGGMDHSKMAGMDRGPAKDADHEFLRMMSDHHQGLVTMMDAAMNRASSAEAKADAHELHTKQSEERDRMVGMLKTSYGETIEPMVMPSNKAMNDSLQQKSGTEYDRDMYRRIIMHHREALQMIDRFMPRLQNAAVRSMAEKMRADQEREIAEFERKQQAR